MPTLRLSLIFALAFASWAQAAPPPHVVARAAESSGALGGTTLTLWSDGHAELMNTRGGGEHLSGQVPKAPLAELLTKLQATGLTKERYTQRPKHPIIQHGFSRLELYDGAKLHALQQPALGRPNAATKALSARVGEAAKLLHEVVRAHLETRSPSGRYAMVYVLGEATEASRRETPEPTPAMKRALQRPGSYVLLKEARDTLKHGARGVVDGREVVWILQELEAPEKR